MHHLRPSRFRRSTPRHAIDAYGCDRLEQRQLLAAVDLVVRLNPDLPATLPEVMVPGEDLPTVSFQIRRVGAVAIQSVQLQLAASTDSGWSEDDTVFLDVPIQVNIDADAPSTRWYNKTLSTEQIASTLRPGRYTFLIRVLHDGDANTDPRPANNTRVIKADQRIVWAFGTVAGRSGVAMELTDLDGTLGAFSLSDGTGRVIETPDGLVVRVFSASADASLTISSRGFGAGFGDDGQFGLARVVSSGPIGSVTLSQVMVTDRVLLERDVRQVRLQSCAFPLPGSGVFLTMPVGGQPEITISGDVSRLLISSARELSSIEFWGGNARAVSITAPSVGALTASGDLELHRIRLEPIFGRLTTLTVGGRLSSTGLISIARAPSLLSAYSIDVFRAQFGTSVDLITTTGPADQQAISRTTIAAPSFGRIEIPGKVTGSTTFAAGGTFRARIGSTPELVLTGPGSFGSVIVGEGEAGSGSKPRFLAGINGRYFDAPSTFRTFGATAASTIGSFTLLRAGTTQSLIVAARTISRVTIGTLQIVNPSTNPNFILVRDP